MKKLLILPVLSLLALTGCNTGGDEGGGTTGPTPDQLESDLATAKAKLKQLGKDSGLEITYHFFEDSGDEANIAFGLKGDYFWVVEEDNDTHILIKQDGESVLIYSDYAAGVYSNPVNVGTETVDTYFESFSSPFFQAYTVSYGGDYYKVGDTTYKGRSAIEYKYDYAYAGVYASSKVIVDKDTDITLYWKISGSDGVASSSGGFEVTEFKVGDQVSVPSHS